MRFSQQFLRSIALFVVCVLQGCNPHDFPQTAQEYDVRACEKYDRQEYEKAVNDWDFSVKLDPKNGVYYWRRARACRQFGRLDQSIDDADKAIDAAERECEKDPKNKRAKRRLTFYMHTRAECYAKRGTGEDHAMALKEFNKAIELSGGGLDSAPMYMDRGRLYLALDETDKAIQDFSKAIELVPTWGRAYFFRAKAYDLIRDFEHARKDHELAGDMNYEESDDRYEPLPIRSTL